MHGVAGIRHAVSGAGVPQIVVTILVEHLFFRRLARRGGA